MFYRKAPSSCVASLAVVACLLLAACGNSKITITSPRSGDVFYGCEQITFAGRVSGTQAWLLSAAKLHWSSSLDGSLDNGTKFTWQSLSSGTHTITLTATGMDGTALTDSVEITIQPPGAPKPFSGVAVDPYIVGATFYEDRNNNGNCDAGEQQSSATDDSGHFSFPDDVSACSTIRMKEKGLHIGLPFLGDIKARAAEAWGRTDNESLHIVSPLTTLLANGWTRGQVVQLLRASGIPGITREKLDHDPMEGMCGLDVRCLADGRLALIRSTITVSTVLQIIDAIVHFQPIPGLASGFDITYTQLQELNEFFELFVRIGRMLTKVISFRQIRQAVENIGQGTVECISGGFGVPPLVTADIFIRSATAIANFFIAKFSKDLTYMPADNQTGGWALELANSFFVIKYKTNPCILHLIQNDLLPDVADDTACWINPDTEKVECF